MKIFHDLRVLIAIVGPLRELHIFSDDGALSHTGRQSVMRERREKIYFTVDF